MSLEGILIFGPIKCTKLVAGGNNTRIPSPTADRILIFHLELSIMFKAQALSRIFRFEATDRTTKLINSSGQAKPMLARHWKEGGWIGAAVF